MNNFNKVHMNIPHISKISAQEFDENANELWMRTDDDRQVNYLITSSPLKCSTAKFVIPDLSTFAKLSFAK